ncbi:MAG: hypothetical protein ACRDJP_05125 [Actinomycetota bacterium]
MSAHEVDVAARRLVALAELDAEDLTETVSHAARLANADLVGLDNRIKSVESLRRKLADLMAQDPTLTVDEGAERVYDVLRFTVVAEPDRYMAVHDGVLVTLAAQGVAIVQDANHWAGPRYRGINSQLMATGHRRFEVQFHTRDSYAAVKATRGLYEEFRHAATPPPRRAELAAQIGAVFARVPVPPAAVP